MIDAAVTYIQQLIVAYGAGGVFLATLLEEIVAPIPSAVVPLAAGFFLLPADQGFAAIALETLWLVALPVALGITVGSSIIYAVAYIGGKPIIERFGGYAGLQWKMIESIEARMSKGRADEVTLFTLRLMPIIPGVALTGFCGAVRYSFKAFATITFIASLIRAYILALIGWQTGEVYARYVEEIGRYEDIGLLVLLSIGAGALVVHLLRKRSRASGPDRSISSRE